MSLQDEGTFVNKVKCMLNLRPECSRIRGIWGRVTDQPSPLSFWNTRARGFHLGLLCRKRPLLNELQGRACLHWTAFLKHGLAILIGVQKRLDGHRCS